MKIRFVRPWRRWKPGDIMEPADGYANVLVRRHIAEVVPIAAAKRGRGRPRIHPRPEDA